MAVWHPQAHWHPNRAEPPTTGWRAGFIRAGRELYPLKGERKIRLKKIRALNFKDFSNFVTREKQLKRYTSAEEAFEALTEDRPDDNKRVQERDLADYVRNDYESSASRREKCKAWTAFMSVMGMYTVAWIIAENTTQRGPHDADGMNQFLSGLYNFIMCPITTIGTQNVHPDAHPISLTLITVINELIPYVLSYWMPWVFQCAGSRNSWCRTRLCCCCNGRTRRLDALIETAEEENLLERDERGVFRVTEPIVTEGLSLAADESNADPTNEAKQRKVFYQLTKAKIRRDPSARSSILDSYVAAGGTMHSALHRGRSQFSLLGRIHESASDEDENENKSASGSSSVDGNVV